MTDQGQPLGDVTADASTDLTQVVETPARIEPVQPPAGGPKRSRARWAVALGGAAIVVAVSAAVAFALVGRSPEATVLGYVPSGTIVYGEVRLDLPGDQARKVGEFLSHFPGFRDQAALDTKLDEVLDQLVGDATDDKQTFAKDIKPWFDGELAFSAGPLPDPASLSKPDATNPDLGRALVLLSIKDEAGARAWFDAAFKEAGATTTTETYDGVTLTVFGGTDGPTAAFAILDGKVALAGEIASVKAAVDTKGAGGFAKDPDAQKALRSASGDHVGLIYMALRPLLDWSQQVSASMADEFSELGAPSPTTAMSAAMLDLIPDWTAYWLRFEADALVLETTAPPAKTAVGPTENRSSDVARHVPASALVLSVAHDMGETLTEMLALYKDEPAFKEAIDQAIGVAGGPEAALGWIGDTGIVVNRAGDALEGGLVILPTDPAAASRLFTSLRNLAGLSGEAGLTFREETFEGTTITVASVDLAASGASAFAVPLGKVEIAWAVTDDLVVVGSGPDFVKHVLATTDADSLAANDRYKALTGRVGTGVGSWFVDITGVRTVAERAIAEEDPSALKHYATDIKPFLEPFDALVASGKVEGDLTRSTIVITVK